MDVYSGMCIVVLLHVYSGLSTCPKWTLSTQLVQINCVESLNALTMLSQPITNSLQSLQSSTQLNNYRIFWYNVLVLSTTIIETLNERISE